MQHPRTTTPPLPEGELEALVHGNLLSLGYFDLEETASERPQPPTAKSDEIVRAYRERGFRFAALNPLTNTHPFGRLSAKPLPKDAESTLLSRLNRIYCGGLCVEAPVFYNPADEAVFFNLFESISETPLKEESLRRALFELLSVEALEARLKKTSPSAKRFALEGSEGLIPLLSALFESATHAEYQHLFLAMSHRGRLSLLSSLLGLEVSRLERMLEDHSQEEPEEGGDVLYHLGAESLWREQGREMSITLCANPSHLESVNAVMQGLLRAKMEETPKEKALGVCLHGDGAFSGQGAVYESFQLSRLPATSVGGMIHLILNNQIGFTLESEGESRSTPSASDLAKTFGIPVLHVNATSLPSLLKAARIALAYKEACKSDIIIHLIAYRQGGHNEADDPSATSPLLYREIKSKPKVSLQALEESKSLKPSLLPIQSEVDLRLENARTLSPFGALKTLQSQAVLTPMAPLPEAPLSEALFEQAVEGFHTLPQGFSAHRIIERLARQRESFQRGQGHLDFGGAELLAFASLVLEGFKVRLLGQDSKRGTFSQRHLSYFDQETGEAHTPLALLGPGEFRVYDAILSEYASLGFEYGHSLLGEKKLNLWEAQFGDFANGAQILFDQFLASGEEKWGQRSGLVCLLPHGLDGQGPEHSSARIERFLELSARDNWRLFSPTTATQMYTLLRALAHAEDKKPALVFTPKSLFRHAHAHATKEGLKTARFEPFLIHGREKKEPKVAFLCVGKVGVELLEFAGEEDLSEALVVQIEQLYPFPREGLAEALRAFPSLKVWCSLQEEPHNQGAYLNLMRDALIATRKEAGVEVRLEALSRPEASAPAPGGLHAHQSSQKRLLEAAIALSRSFLSKESS